MKQAYLDSIENHLVQSRKKLDFYFSNYENFITLGDFNAKMTNTQKEEFCSVYNLKNLKKAYLNVRTQKKLPPLTINLLTNQAKCFQHSEDYETGLSD